MTRLKGRPPHQTTASFVTYTFDASQDLRRSFEDNTKNFDALSKLGAKKVNGVSALSLI